MTPRPLVLIVDDEPDLCAVVDFHLRRSGYDTLLAASGREALAQAMARSPQIVVLDLNLPDIPGTEVCRRLRADPRTHEMAIVMLTARGTETDRVTGFEFGADDYVVKPFSVRELVLRVQALERRLPKEAAEPTERLLVRGGVTLDRAAFLCHTEGREVSLTALEFRLLGYLMEGEGRVRTREDLLADVWNASTELETRTIDTHIKRLRDKLGKAGELIETVRGVGYRFRE